MPLVLDGSKALHASVTQTVIRLGASERLYRRLATTSPVESSFSVLQDVTRHMKRWCMAT